MSDCKDFEQKLGIRTGKIKLVIPGDGYENKLFLTIEKRTQAGKNTLEVKMHGKKWQEVARRASVGNHDPILGCG